MDGLFFRHRLVVEPSASLGLSPYICGLAADYPRPGKSGRAFQQFTLFSLSLLSCIMHRMREAIYGPSRLCACGCGNEFTPRLNYRHKDENGKPSFPIYKRGHHPKCRGTQTSTWEKAWNAGLKKGDHPSIERMGYQPGHKPYNDWSHVNEKLATDPALKARWLAAKKGQVAWNTGLTKEQYKNGIASGPAHGNWMGGHGGVRDTAAFKSFRYEIMKRDKWTCQICGDHNHKGRGSRIVLHVDHIEPITFAPERALDPTNARTLCFECHKKTETYGLKVRGYIRKRQQTSGG